MHRGNDVRVARQYEIGQRRRSSRTRTVDDDAALGVRAPDLGDGLGHEVVVLRLEGTVGLAQELERHLGRRRLVAHRDLVPEREEPPRMGLRLPHQLIIILESDDDRELVL